MARNLENKAIQDEIAKRNALRKKQDTGTPFMAAQVLKLLDMRNTLWDRKDLPAHLSDRGFEFYRMFVDPNKYLEADRQERVKQNFLSEHQYKLLYDKLRYRTFSLYREDGSVDRKKPYNWASIVVAGDIGEMPQIPIDSFPEILSFSPPVVSPDEDGFPKTTQTVTVTLHSDFLRRAGVIDDDIESAFGAIQDDMSTYYKKFNELLIEQFGVPVHFDPDLKRYMEESPDPSLRNLAERGHLIFPSTDIRPDFNPGYADYSYKMFAYYYDMAFDLPVPFSPQHKSRIRAERNLDQVAMIDNSINNAPTAFAMPKYNYLIPWYESEFGLTEQGREWPEILLPHIHSMILESENRELDSEIGEPLGNLTTFNHTTLGMPDLIPPVRPEMILNEGGEIVGANYSQREYYRTYVDNYCKSMIREVPIYESLVNCYKNLIVPSSNHSILEAANRGKHLFPMFNTVSFSAPAASSFAGTLKESNLSAKFINDLPLAYGQEDPHQQIMHMKYRFVKNEMVDYASDPLNDDPAQKDFEKKVFGETNSVIPDAGLRSWNVIDWWKGFNDASSLGLEEEIQQGEEIGEMIQCHNAIVLDNHLNPEAYIDNSPEYLVLRNILKIIFKGKLKTMMKEYGRTYESIINGQKAHSEIAFFSVEKYDPSIPFAEGEEQKPIQTVFITNTDESKVIDYVDTQVKYGKRYEYKIHAFCLVIGTKYRFKERVGEIGSKIRVDPSDLQWAEGNAQFPDGCIMQADFDVETSPCVRLIRVPYAPTEVGQQQVRQNDVGEWEAYDESLRPRSLISNTFEYSRLVSRVIDDSPLYPNVDFVPYKGVDRKMRITLTPNTGEYEDNRRSIDSFEGLSAGWYRFRSDDIPAAYVVYRTDVHPGNYTDFANTGKVHKLYSLPGMHSPELQSVVDMDESQYRKMVWQRFQSDLDRTNVSYQQHGQGASSITIVDDLKPNKKYYYTFRTVDYHAHLSNPSEVFEVSLINSDGAVYPVVNIVGFKEKSLKKAMRTGKKYIRISPAASHRVVNEDASGFVEDVIPLSNQVVLGAADQANKSFLWDSKKKYKIRLTGKKSCRQLDINLNFALTKKSPPDFPLVREPLCSDAEEIAAQLAEQQQRAPAVEIPGFRLRPTPPVQAGEPEILVEAHDAAADAEPPPEGSIGGVVGNELDQPRNFGDY